MRSFFILIALCFSSLVVFGQKLELAKASPFTAVKWEEDQPIVQFDNEWYHFEKLDHLSKEEVLAFCKSEFGGKWKRRFSEDLVEVLEGLSYAPNVKVELQLSQNGVSKRYIGTFTLANRQRALQYNASSEQAKRPQKITKAQAIEDLKEFEKILESRSSYAQISGVDYKAAIKELSASIAGRNKDIDINELAHEMAKIMAQIGDRHSSIKNESFNSRGNESYNLKLPFGVVTIEGKLVAIKQNLDEQGYDYYYEKYPYLKSIDGVFIATLVNSYNYKAAKAPTAAKNTRGAVAIENYGALLFNNNMDSADSVQVVFSDGMNEKTETFQLTSDEKGYSSIVNEANDRNSEQVANGNLAGLSKVLDHNIGYIKLPEMYHYDEVEGLEVFIQNTFARFSTTKALIIDVRNNPGGVRDILQTVASYVVQPAQSPWVANVAYLRTDKTLNTDEESMNARYMYSYHSEEFTDSERNAIDQFNKSFKPEKTVDRSKFSDPYFMILHHGNQSYPKPVYILVNESSFSAATVFTSALKGLPNVKIVGETTDGSSGNSRELYLTNSNIRVKVSTMLSFQRNGKTLDGNGTLPDIIIPKNEAQVLKGIDVQLNRLIEMINR
ncbi:S41 family peptidase [Roseivirga sp.]|uniref:S41 family peptidase n=1 Tax=Roseivirga sp. TaxID=1964215 RepID=UPI002B2757A7|nr:S41 family peptidase [Roseivirga sp.]